MSDKPLAERLQVKPGRRLALLSAPDGVATDLAATPQAPLSEAEVVLVFFGDRVALDAGLGAVVAAAAAGAILWVAYPKLTSPLARDLNRNLIHALVPAHGLTTVAQIAVDADWSAMRLKPAA